MNGKATSWIAGTVVVALLLCVAGWFLVISPQLASTADLASQNESETARNQILRLQLDKLTAEAKKLPQYKVEIAKVRAGIPTTAELTVVSREIDALADKHKVVIVAIAASTPVSAVPPAPAVQSVPAKPVTAGDPVTDPSASPSPTPSPSATPGATAKTSTGQPPAPKFEGLTAIPLSVTVVGPAQKSEEFLADVRTAMHRMFLVTTLTSTAQKDAPAGGGRPATKIGDVELVITGYAYVLTDFLAEIAPAAPTELGPLPVGPDRNVYKPVK